MRFKIKFNARKRGGIGERESFTEIVEAPSHPDALLKLYVKYEHISECSHVRLMFAPTYMGKDYRTLMRTNQGRFHFETRDAAQGWLDAITKNNSEEQLASMWGSQAAFEVREIECWDHGDARRTVFE